MVTGSETTEKLLGLDPEMLGVMVTEFVLIFLRVTLSGWAPKQYAKPPKFSDEGVASRRAFTVPSKGTVLTVLPFESLNNKGLTQILICTTPSRSVFENRGLADCTR